MIRPVFVVMVGDDNKPEATLWNSGKSWHVTETDCAVELGPIIVDDMPAHWIEQMRRWPMVGKRLERKERE